MRIPIGAYNTAPMVIPNVIAAVMRLPHCCRIFSGTYVGAKIAHKVERYPLVIPSRNVFRILNQSAPNNHTGPVSNMMQIKVAKKIKRQ